MTFEARDLAWAQATPGNVVATIVVKAAEPAAGGDFTFPMEFTPLRDTWQLTRQTADLLLELGDGDLPYADRAERADMWIGWLEFDLLLGDVRSLKQKRSAIRPVIAELQRRFAVSAAETGSQDLHRRANIGLAVVSADRAHVVEVLDAAERLVAARPEVELLSARRGLRRSNDD